MFEVGNSKINDKGCVYLGQAGWSSLTYLSLCMSKNIKLTTKSVRKDVKIY